MNRALWICFLWLMAAGCALPPERVPLKPLYDDSPPQPYSELLGRARVQATAATESFYVNGWTDLEDLARGLEQTARFLPRALDIPDRHKDKIQEKAAELQKESKELREAARAQNVKLTNEVMQRINLMVRDLRMEN